MGEYHRPSYDKSNNTSGIYRIINKINNKFYIGQACDLDNRWIRHKSELRNNRHHNQHLQNAWNKYGEDVFSFEIIELCPIEKLNDREIYWINFYNAVNKGYNISEGGLGCSGYKHTKEEIQKMRQSHNPIPVLQLDESLNIIKRWESIAQASKELNLYSRAIRHCCNKENYVKSVGGFIWVYEFDYNLDNLSYYIAKDVSLPKRVGKFDKKLSLLETFDSVSNAAKSVDGSTGMVSSVCNHKRGKRSYKGFIWAFIDDNDEIIDKDSYDYYRKTIN